MLKRGQFVLLSMAMVFGLPFVASWVLVWHPEWLPTGRSNHGQLITPPVTTSLTGAWTLLVPSSEKCDRECQRAQEVARLVRRALGAEARHVNGPADCRSKEMRSTCKALSAAVGDEAKLVIVDPMGNAMMRYAADVTPRDLLKDVQRLIKVSRNWRFDGDQ